MALPARVIDWDVLTEHNGPHLTHEVQYTSQMIQLKRITQIFRIICIL